MLVTIALLCAISVLLSFVEFPLLPGVAWLSYDASIMPAAVCGFAYGPAAGLACGIISVVAHGILFADFTGALMNLLVVIGFILPSALVYKKIHTLKGAIIGLVLGIVFAVIMAVLGNLVVTPGLARRAARCRRGHDRAHPHPVQPAEGPFERHPDAYRLQGDLEPHHPEERPG